MLAAAPYSHLYVHPTVMPEVSNPFCAHVNAWYLLVWTGHALVQIRISHIESQKSLKANWSEAPYCVDYKHFGLL